MAASKGKEGEVRTLVHAGADFSSPDQAGQVISCRIDAVSCFVVNPLQSRTSCPRVPSSGC